jgi:murein DD-endopeptidase MepM/ murein hydrolase activator NlpD
MLAQAHGRRIRSAAPESRPTNRQEAPTTARRSRNRIVLALILAVGALGLTPALADTKDELDAAKAELAEAQAELDDATATWQDAERELDITKDEIELTRRRIHGLELRLARIETRLQKRAVIAFTNGPASTIDLLLSSNSFTEFSDRLEFLGSVAQDDVDLSIEQRVAQEELRRERDDLEGLAERQTATTEQLEAAAERIERSLGGIQATVSSLTEEYREELAAARALVVIGQNPNPNPTSGSPFQRCPVAGPNSFVDSFGWPRDGHTHQGIDLIAPFGVPIVAAHAGTVSYSSSSSGGLQAYVRMPSGSYTFYAHLDSYSGVAGQNVAAGTVLGLNGSTGNAGSTNHLHFEYHPGGGAAINPYHMLLAVC